MSEVITTTIDQLEAQRAGLHIAVDLRNAIQRLTRNPDFKLVIERHFMEIECARYAQAAGEPNLNERQQTDAMNIAKSAGHLKRFLSAHILLGNKAEDDIISIGEALDEARAEEVDPESDGQ